MLFFTDPHRTPAPEDTVSLLHRGSAVVYRAFDSADALSVGRSLAKVARRRGVLLFVGADQNLAIQMRADGLHLPERLGGRVALIMRLRRRFLITAAAHSLPAARRAFRAGADAVVVSPVFESRSASAGPPLGHRTLAGLVRAAGGPIYALGGVNLATLGWLSHTGVVGFAAIDAFRVDDQARISPVPRT
jgi:thiamine-phosphate pyrophosphorylase